MWSFFIWSFLAMCSFFSILSILPILSCAWADSATTANAAARRAASFWVMVFLSHVGRGGPAGVGRRGGGIPYWGLHWTGAGKKCTLFMYIPPAMPKIKVTE